MRRCNDLLWAGWFGLSLTLVVAGGCGADVADDSAGPAEAPLFERAARFEPDPGLPGSEELTPSDSVVATQTPAGLVSGGSVVRIPAPTDRSAEAPPAIERPGERPVPAEPPDLTPGAERPPTVALQHIDVRGEIVGNIAEIEVEQTFENTFGDRIEAVYVFPLPEDAAVRDLVMVIGDRRIRADLLQREAARETYQAARDQGHTASLLEQERPNIFTMSVANLEPGVPIRVLVRYVEQLRYADGRYHFAFPTVVGPRFIPGQPSGRQGEGALPDTDVVLDASRITPAVLPEGETTPYPIDFAVDLFAGMPIRELQSASHDFDAAWATEHAVQLSLSEHERRPDRDIAFNFAVADADPATGLLAHFEERGGFFSLMVEPPASLAESDVRPKEIVFVIDMSGSMRGQPLDAAKGVVRHAIAHLNPDDTFQIIRFSESASGFSDRAVPNTPGNVAAGLAFIDALSGGGGTQMIEGIRAALDPEPDPERLRVVLFLTDGFIGNESQIFEAVDDRVGQTRIFALGVGSAPNRFLLDRLAEVGRGSVQYVNIDEEPTEAVEAFYRRVRNPVLTELTIDWGGLAVDELTPSRLPDVFEGTPLLVTGRYQTPGAGTITIRGQRGRDPIELVLDVDLSERSEYPAIPYLWARRQIDDLERQVAWARSDELRRPIVDLSLEFRVLTQYTAFVAVDETVTADLGDPLRTMGVPVALPDGMSGAAIGPQMIDSNTAPGEGDLAAGFGVTGTGRGGGGHGVGFGRGLGMAGGGAPNLGQAPVVLGQASSGRASAGSAGVASPSTRSRRARRRQHAGRSELMSTPAPVSYADLASVVGADQAALQACLVDLFDEPTQITLEIDVDPDGRVADIEFVTDIDVPDTALTCLRERLRALGFESFQGETVWFRYVLRVH